MNHPLSRFETSPLHNDFIMAAAVYPTAVGGKKRESGATCDKI